MVPKVNVGSYEKEKEKKVYVGEAMDYAFN